MTGIYTTPPGTVVLGLHIAAELHCWLLKYCHIIAAGILGLRRVCRSQPRLSDKRPCFFPEVVRGKGLMLCTPLSRTSCVASNKNVNICCSCCMSRKWRNMYLYLSMTGGWKRMFVAVSSETAGWIVEHTDGSHVYVHLIKTSGPFLINLHLLSQVDTLSLCPDMHHWQCSHCLNHFAGLSFMYSHSCFHFGSHRSLIN